MTYQQTALTKARKSTQADDVYRYILTHQGRSLVQVAQGMGIQEKSLCGRVGDLVQVGRVWYNTPPDGPKLLMATDDPASIARNLALYQRDAERKAFVTLRKSANVIRQHLTKTETAQLRAIFSRLTPALAGKI